MSIVGPRPLFDDDTYYFDEHYLRRLNVLPGITGLLQINERNTSEFETWFNMILSTLKTGTYMLDIKIILKTPFFLFSNQNKVS